MPQGRSADAEGSSVTSANRLGIISISLGRPLHIPRTAKQLADSKSLFFTTDKGYEGVSPLVGIEAKYREQLTKMGDRFGLSPAARSGMRVATDVPAENAYEAFRRSRPRGKN